jgi:hypothetical protein
LEQRHHPGPAADDLIRLFRHPVALRSPEQGFFRRGAGYVRPVGSTAGGGFPPPLTHTLAQVAGLRSSGRVRALANPSTWKADE